MLRLVYSIQFDKTMAELAWLKSMFVFASTATVYDPITFVRRTRIGIIVSPEVAIIIKLRHKVDSVVPYEKSKSKSLF